MKKEILIRKNVFSLLIQMIAAVLVFFIVFSLVNFYIDYEELENKSPINYIITFDAITLIVFVLVSLVILFFIFIHWYLYTIRINNASVHYYSGLFFKKCKLDFKDIESVSYRSGIIGDILEYGTIYLKKISDKKIIKSTYLPNPKYYAEMIRSRLKSNRNKKVKLNNDVSELIHQGENLNTEFKRSLRWDIKLNKVNKDLEKAVMRTICGFMNAEGGILLIGVGDDGIIEGLESDYKTFKKYGKDYFEGYLYQIFGLMVGKEYMHLIDITFYDFGGKNVCLIHVPASDEPVYLKTDNQDVFYVRTGNTTQPLMVREANKYIKSHWAIS